jgi:hypothetical protein
LIRSLKTSLKRTDLKTTERNRGVGNSDSYWGRAVGTPDYSRRE